MVGALAASDPRGVELEPVVQPSVVSTGAPPLPRAVTARLEPGEQPTAVIVGAQSSGLVLTDRRVIRWRPPGAIAVLPIEAITAVELRRATSEHPALLTFSTSEHVAPVAIALDQRHVPAAMDALQVIVGTIHVAHRTRLRAPVDVTRAQSVARTTWRFELDRQPRRRILGEFRRT
jgi:hypothetical protein